MHSAATHALSGEIATPSGTEGTAACATVRNGRDEVSTKLITSASATLRPCGPALPACPTLPITAHRPEASVSTTYGLTPVASRSWQQDCLGSGQVHHHGSLLVAQGDDRGAAVGEHCPGRTTCPGEMQALRRVDPVVCDAEHQHARRPRC